MEKSWIYGISYNKVRKNIKGLKDEKLFNCAKVDVGGYAIIWNEEIDLSSEEIWNNGY